MVSAKIILDSISKSGIRLTTMECRYQRFIHSEVMTHRMFSRNAASSRAIPVTKMMESVMEDPAMPVYWGKAQSGMSAKEELSSELIDFSIDTWLTARRSVVEYAKILVDAGLHKQIANRILEPFCHMTTIITSTEWHNFFKLRCAPDAQPEFKYLADLMLKEYTSSIPQYRPVHLPYVMKSDSTLEEEFIDGGYAWDDLKRISAARCARVSYLTHDGKRDPMKDLELYERLHIDGHDSPLEHPATEQEIPKWMGNFYGWTQLRKEMEIANMELEEALRGPLCVCWHGEARHANDDGQCATCPSCINFTPIRFHAPPIYNA